MSRFRFIPRHRPVLSHEEMYALIERPIITEKATNISEHNQVTFQVPLSADKR